MNKILWFRYDLRLENNESAIEALKDGYVLPIFIFDEDFLKLETSSSFHVQFTIQSLVELRKEFKHKYNTKLNIYYGDTKEIINSLCDKFKINEIYSTYHFKNKYLQQLDNQIEIICNNNNINWKKFNQFGIQLNNREGKTWSRNWNSFIGKKIENQQIQASFLKDDYEIDFLAIKTNDIDYKSIQIGGRSQALELLDSFVNNRSTNYQKEMSSPIPGETALGKAQAPSERDHMYPHARRSSLRVNFPG